MIKICMEKEILELSLIFINTILTIDITSKLLYE